MGDRVQRPDLMFHEENQGVVAMIDLNLWNYVEIFSVLILGVLCSLQPGFGTT